MRRVSIVTISTLAALATGIVACSSDSDSSGGSGGSAATGGAAGSSTGGVSGSSTGGAAGSATGGSGGATGGAAGSATGGTAGAATGGTGGGAGACTNAADTAILDDPNLMAEEKISQCGNDNLGQEPGTSNCIKQQTGLSDPCVGCFGATIQCAATNCWLQCIGGSDSQPCKDCLAQFCDAAFEACSGLSAT